MNEYTVQQSFEERFPQLHEAIFAAQTPRELGKIVKDIVKKYDDGTLSYPACDGAIVEFKKACRAQWAVTELRTAKDARIHRILTIPTGNGGYRARKFS